MSNETLTKAMHSAGMLRQDIRDLLTETTPCSEAERYPIAMLAREARLIEEKLVRMLKENSGVDTATTGR